MGVPWFKQRCNILLTCFYYYQIRYISLPVLQIRRTFGFFCSTNHLSGDGVNANHNTWTRFYCPAWPARTKVIAAKEIAMVICQGNICQGKEADIAFFLASDKNKKDQKMFEAKYSIIARNWTISSNEPETQKQTKGMEIHWSKITNHDLLNSFKKTCVF